MFCELKNPSLNKMQRNEDDDVVIVSVVQRFDVDADDERRQQKQLRRAAAQQQAAAAQQNAAATVQPVTAEEMLDLQQVQRELDAQKEEKNKKHRWKDRRPKIMTLYCYYVTFHLKSVNAVQFIEHFNNATLSGLLEQVNVLHRGKRIGRKDDGPLLSLDTLRWWLKSHKQAADEQ